ncbi:hypothetical protein Mlute_01091 [Meiothermus luteus]|jgi:hypothetical protein|uniref:Uncharacterized protein n=1 Tax=Meiothermus luteus TaxID=2026184 RepID=A0A399EQU8_9DEIN|nr:hypothetical protein [Meiothermus luteus]RIH87014.1 hypothetical protein Mlute_01091 [Meiothermus luteus]RMH54971.1 MAG: hypothetical protein D6684_08605 [Deinococcota bacterium]
MFGLFRKPDEHVKREGDAAFRVRVRTARNKEVVELRLSKGGEISASDEGGYYVRKVVVSPKHLDRAVLEIWFDRAYRPVRKVVEGGELVPIREWS